MVSAHKRGRIALSKAYARDQAQTVDAVKAVYRPELDRFNRNKFAHLEQVKEAHRKEAVSDERRRQAREAERAAAAGQLDKAIEVQKRMVRADQGKGKGGREISI
jgi:hypothetical protein